MDLIAIADFAAGNSQSLDSPNTVINDLCQCSQWLDDIVDIVTFSFWLKLLFWPNSHFLKQKTSDLLAVAKLLILFDMWPFFSLTYLLATV